MSVCVIFNPSAARGKAGRRLQRIRRLLGKAADFLVSQEPGHSEALACAAARDGYATIVAAGGDGTVHEVANGLLQVGRADVCLGVIPLGSGNDYAASLQLPTDEERLCEGLLSSTMQRVDVGIVTDERGRQRHFINTLGLGLSGAVVWEIQRIRLLRGMALYGLGALRAIWRHFHCPHTILTLDEMRHELPTLFLSVCLGRREGGGFLVAPEAKLDDGWFDYLHAGRLTRWQALTYLPALARGQLPDHDPAIRRGRCRRLSLETPTPLIVHADGELFAQPGDATHTVHIQLLAQALAVRGIVL